LVDVGGIEGKSRVKGRLIFSSVEEPDNSSTSASKTLPTLKELLNADFYHNYYLRILGVEPDLEGDICFDVWGGGYCYHGDLRTESRMAIDGLSLSFIGPPDSQEIKWVWNNRDRLFRESYVDCPITLDEGEGKSLCVTVKVLDAPMKDILEMSPMEKWHFADMVIGHEHTFSGIIDEALFEFEDLMKSKSDCA